MEPAELRVAIRKSLVAQGFTLNGEQVVPPEAENKAALRRLHATAVEHRVAKARRGLMRHEPTLLKRMAVGSTVDPASIRPHLVEVLPNTQDELLFRYARLHWSIPVSAGYGRRLRFLVIDRANNKLMGLIGLGDPVFALGPRDRWVGWDRERRRTHLTHVMDAFVLGAVPPYSFLLGGKLVAMLAASDDVQAAFARKYNGASGLISNTAFDGRLALITTTSALGRSSVYNRLSYLPAQGLPRQRIFEPVGYTLGSGEFHFSNGLYAAMSAYAHEHCAPTAKASPWGAGFRNRRELVKKVLQHIDMSESWLYHGVKRQAFVAPLATNTAAFLRGDDADLHLFRRPSEAIADYWHSRWCMPRASKDTRWRSWDPNNWRLWTDELIRF